MSQNSESEEVMCGQLPQGDWVGPEDSWSRGTTPENFWDLDFDSDSTHNTPLAKRRRMVSPGVSQPAPVEEEVPETQLTRDAPVVPETQLARDTHGEEVVPPVMQVQGMTGSMRTGKAQLPAVRRHADELLACKQSLPSLSNGQSWIVDGRLPENGGDEENIMAFASGPGSKSAMDEVKNILHSAWVGYPRVVEDKDKVLQLIAKQEVTIRNLTMQINNNITVNMFAGGSEMKTIDLGSKKCPYCSRDMGCLFENKPRAGQKAGQLKCKNKSCNRSFKVPAM